MTEGSIEAAGVQPWWSVNAPKMRADVNARTAALIEAQFNYLGPTSTETPLASGALRRQFGLKLRAQNACNLVYAMWRIEPQSRLVVSVKSNPAQHSSTQCGNRGYRNIKAERSAALPELRPGQLHKLRAQMNNAQLEVFADSALVWSGSVGTDAVEFDAPVGIRSDDVQLQLRTAPPSQGSSEPVQPCRSGAEAAE